MQQFHTLELSFVLSSAGGAGQGKPLREVFCAQPLKSGS